MDSISGGLSPLIPLDGFVLGGPESTPLHLVNSQLVSHQPAETDFWQVFGLFKIIQRFIY